MKIVSAISLWALLAIAQTAHSSPNDQRLEGCRSKLKAAAQISLLKDMSFKDGRPKVVIGPTWYRMDFEAKTGFAETAACFFLAGDSTKSITFPIYDSMTGKQVATWKFTKLEVR